MMDILNSIDRKISSFVDAGGTSLVLAIFNY